MKFVYGPVPSRRLGSSLGIDPIPSKTCNYQCIYCQLGKTTNFTNTRENFFAKEDIIAEMEESINLNENEFDYITFVGSGEPTLYKDLKSLIIKAKKESNKPVCVITNGSLLFNEKVQDALSHSDLVLPSLDSGDEKGFIKINRPHHSISFNKMIQGFIDFKKNYTGKIWIEVMLLNGINDTKTELLKIKEKIDLVKPDRIDINFPIRPPTEDWVKIPDIKVFSTLNDIFKNYSNINYPEKGIFKTYSHDFEYELLAIIERHPMRQDQIIETFSSLNHNEIISLLYKLESQKKIKKMMYNKQLFWKLNLN